MEISEKINSSIGDNYSNRFSDFNNKNLKSFQANKIKTNVETIDINSETFQIKTKPKVNSISGAVTTNKAESILVSSSSFLAKIQTYVEETCATISNFFKSLFNKEKVQKIELEEAENSYDFFEGFNYPGRYGVNQGEMYNLCVYEYNGTQYTYYHARALINEAKKNGEPLPIFNPVILSPKTYEKLVNKVKEYGFSEEDSEFILTLIDDAGACSYASTCNEIFHQFSNNPEAFKEVFGYDMYITSTKGYQVLNSPELLLDLYLYANDEKNGGKLWKDGKINKNLLSNEIDPLGRTLIDVGEHQVYMSSDYKNEEVIENFLKSKEESLDYKTSKLSITDANHCIYAISKQLEEGKSITLDYYYNPNYEDRKTNIHMQSYDENASASVDTITWSEGSGHSVLITGVTDEGLIVSSWGHKYHIPASDLKFDKNCYIYCSDICTN